MLTALSISQRFCLGPYSVRILDCQLSTLRVYSVFIVLVSYIADFLQRFFEILEGAFSQEHTWLVVWDFLSSIDLYCKLLNPFQRIFCFYRIFLEHGGSMERRFVWLWHFCFSPWTQSTQWFVRLLLPGLCSRFSSTFELMKLVQSIPFQYSWV